MTIHLSSSLYSQTSTTRQADATRENPLPGGQTDSCRKVEKSDAPGA